MEGSSDADPQTRVFRRGSSDAGPQMRILASDGRILELTDVPAYGWARRGSRKRPKETHSPGNPRLFFTLRRSPFKKKVPDRIQIIRRFHCMQIGGQSIDDFKAVARYHTKTGRRDCDRASGDFCPGTLSLTVSYQTNAERIASECKIFSVCLVLFVGE